MAITTQSDMLDLQILVDAVRGRFQQKNAFMGSTLVSSGAAMVSGTMPEGGPTAIGKTITVPYFGVIGDFVANADGSSVTPVALGQTSEDATVARKSLAIEVSRWAQGLGAADPALGDPYEEATNQLERAAQRCIDQSLIDEAVTTPLVSDVYNSGSPVYVSWDGWIDAITKLGDEQDEIVAAIVHSQTRADMAKLKDDQGRPLLVADQTMGPGSVMRFAGIPIITSDKAPLTGSSMGSVSSSGSTPPVATLSGTPLGAYDLVIDCVAGGAHETATYRFSTDGGNTWSATLTTPAATVSTPLTDTAVDSLVGKNGSTGISVAFAAGTFNADNQWTATANLKATDLIIQRGALAFWYSAAHLGMKMDEDILADTDIAAMHLYYAPHLYRRRRNGTRPGVVAFKHNVGNYVG